MFAMRLASDDSGGMKTVSLDEAQRQLVELVRNLPFEGELLITDEDKPIARLASAAARPSLRDLQPASVGDILRPFPDAEDDLLSEMLNQAHP
jgi:antitoxin (DNA-binding transcriptional repressor) of toxin-antitoxin stability system